jgi:tetratricopeptide (TPR) repeat protein
MTPIVPLLICALGQPIDDGRETAKRDFERGMHYYNLGEFELALKQFKAAYDVAPHADLLFNIGQCHRNLGQNEDAIFFFERYVEQLPDGDDAEEVRTLLVELRTREPIVYDPPPLTSTIAERRYDLAVPLVRPEDDDPLVEKWWFWAAVMGAAAVAAGGVVLIAALTDPAGRGGTDPNWKFDRDL